MKDLIVLIAIATSAAAPVSSARAGEWTCKRGGDGHSWSVLTASSKENSGTLVVRCTAGQPSLSLRWGIAGSPGPVLVTMRLDDGESTSTWWLRSVDRREFRFAGDPAAYLRALQVGKSLAVRLTPEAVPVADARSSGVDDEGSRNVKPPTIDVPLTMTFDLTGLAAAIGEAHGTCGTP